VGVTTVRRTTCVCDVAVLRATRRGDHYSISDLVVDVELEPAPDAAQPLDEASVLRGVHALAAEFAAGEPETYAVAIARFCRQRVAADAAVRVQVRTRSWHRMTLGGRPRGRDFSDGGDEERVASCESDAAGERVSAGLRNLVLLAAAESVEDAVTVLRLSAHWTYGWADVPYATQWQQVRRVLTEVYAERGDLGGGELARGLGRAVLDEAPPVARVEVSVEETQRPGLDLNAFGLENTGAVFGGRAAARTVHVAELRRSELS
jgi:urate oxidase